MSHDLRRSLELHGVPEMPEGGFDAAVAGAHKRRVRALSVGALVVALLAGGGVVAGVAMHGGGHRESVSAGPKTGTGAYTSPHSAAEAQAEATRILDHLTLPSGTRRFDGEPVAGLLPVQTLPDPGSETPPPVAERRLFTTALSRTQDETFLAAVEAQVGLPTDSTVPFVDAYRWADTGRTLTISVADDPAGGAMLAADVTVAWSLPHPDGTLIPADKVTGGSIDRTAISYDSSGQGTQVPDDDRALSSAEASSLADAVNALEVITPQGGTSLCCFNQTITTTDLRIVAGGHTWTLENGVDLSRDGTHLLYVKDDPDLEARIDALLNSTSPAPTSASLVPAPSPSPVTPHQFESPISEPEADAEAAYLLDHLTLPAGLTSSSGQEATSLPAVIHPSGQLLALAQRHWTTSQSRSQVMAALNSMTGEAGLTTPAPSTVGSHYGEIAWERYNQDALAKTITIDVGDIPGGGSTIRVEAAVQWAPLRGFDTLIPLDQISAGSIQADTSTTHKDGTQSTGHATVGLPAAETLALARLINSEVLLPQEGGGSDICGRCGPGTWVDYTLHVTAGGKDWAFHTTVPYSAYGGDNLDHAGTTTVLVHDADLLSRVAADAKGATPSPSPSSAPSPGAPVAGLPQGHHYEQPTTADQAGQEATYVMSHLRLPAGTTLAQASPSADLGEPGGIVSQNGVTRTLYFQSPGKETTVATSFGKGAQAQLPFDNQQVGNTDQITWSAETADRYETLELQFAPDKGGTAIRADVLVIWREVRPAASVIPLPVTGATVTVTDGFVTSPSPGPGPSTRKVLTQTEATYLAHALNGLHEPLDLGAIAGPACPNTATSYTLRFTASSGDWTVTLSTCFGPPLIEHGGTKTALQAPSSLVARIEADAGGGTAVPAP